MQRALKQLAENVYDLLIIGGCIYGACVAWEATLRGLAVALVDKADFGSAILANSLKIIHGGLRYLQHADLRRIGAKVCDRLGGEQFDIRARTVVNTCKRKSVEVFHSTAASGCTEVVQDGLSALPR